MKHSGNNNLRERPVSNFNISDKYWGSYESTLDGASRLRLNRDIVCVLYEHGIQCLWIYSSPAIPAIILCPDQAREEYIEQAKAAFPKDMELTIAHRKYLCACRSGKYDKQGRIYIPSFGLEHAGIKKEGSVVIIGMGQWFEVWEFDTWQDLSR
jgi:DNA-binding transcriptional regulator/RsmH inhibitor MraZ